MTASDKTEINKISKLLHSANSSEILGGLFLIPKILNLSPDTLNLLVSEIPWDFLLDKNQDLYIEILQKFTISNTTVFFLKFKKFMVFSTQISNDFLILQDEFTIADCKKIIVETLQVFHVEKVSLNQKMILFLLLSTVLHKHSHEQLVQDVQTVYFLLQITCFNLDFLLEKNLLSSQTSAQEINYINLLSILVEQLLNVLILIGEDINSISEKELDILLKIREFLKEYFKGVIEKICDYHAENDKVVEQDLSQSIASVVGLVSFWTEEEGIELHDLPEFKTIVEKFL